MPFIEGYKIVDGKKVYQEKVPVKNESGKVIGYRYEDENSRKRRWTPGGQVSKAAKNMRGE